MASFLPSPDTVRGTCSIAGVLGTCQCSDVNDYLVGSKYEGFYDGKLICAVSQVPQPDPFGKTAGAEVCPGTELGRRRLKHNTEFTDCSGCSGTCAPAEFYRVPTAKANFSGVCSIAGVTGSCRCSDVNSYLVGSKYEFHQGAGNYFNGKQTCAVHQVPQPDPFGKIAGAEVCPLTGGSGRRLAHNAAVTDCTQCTGVCAPEEHYQPDTRSGTCSIAGVAGTCECNDVNSYLVGSKYEFYQGQGNYFNGKMTCAVPQVPQPDPFGKTAGAEVCPSTASGRRLGHNTALTSCTGCSGVCAAAAFYINVTSSSSSDDDTTLIVGLAVGVGLPALLACLIIVYFKLCKKSKK